MSDDEHHEQQRGATPESDTAGAPAPFIPTETQTALADKSAELVFVEGGERAANALLAAGVLPIGLENWAAASGNNGDDPDSVSLHSAFAPIVFAKRKVYLCVSGASDRQTEIRLAFLLFERGAEVYEVAPRNTETLDDSMRQAVLVIETFDHADLPIARAELHRTMGEQGLFESLRRKLRLQFGVSNDVFGDFKSGERREGAADEKPRAGKIINEVEPWPEPVNLSDALLDYAVLLLKYMAMSEAQAVTCAMFCATTFFFEELKIHAFLCISAPTKRCGKTTLLDLVCKFAHRSMQMASDVTDAFVFRCIDRYKPTLALDEAMAAFKKNPGLHAIYNAGHIRDSANVGRVEKGANDKLDPETFNVFGPKILAVKGRLKDDSLQERVIEIRLGRMTEADAVEGDYWEDLAGDLDEVILPQRRKFARAALDLRGKIKGYKPEMPKFENSRTRQNWRAFWIVAEEADLSREDGKGKFWTEKLTEAIKECGEEMLQDPTFVDYLLKALKAFCDEYAKRPSVIARAKDEQDHVLTEDILNHSEGLNADKEAPWSRDDKNLTREKLARELRQFKVRSSRETVSGASRAGYSLKALKRVFDRYL